MVLFSTFLWIHKIIVRFYMITWHGFAHCLYFLVTWLVDTLFDFLIQQATKIKREPDFPYVKCRQRRNRPRRKRHLYAFTAIVAMNAIENAEHLVALNTNAYTIGVYNWCSGCMSVFTVDFVGPL